MLKNALDWLVASGELYEKPVALFNASPRISYAQASLTETLTVMTARLIPEASINAAKATAHGGFQTCSNDDLSERIECAFATFVKACSRATKQTAFARDCGVVHRNSSDHPNFEQMRFSGTNGRLGILSKTNAPAFCESSTHSAIPNAKRALIFQRLSAPLDCAGSWFSKKPIDLSARSRPKKRCIEAAENRKVL